MIPRLLLLPALIVTAGYLTPAHVHGAGYDRSLSPSSALSDRSGTKANPFRRGGQLERGARPNPTSAAERAEATDSSPKLRWQPRAALVAESKSTAKSNNRPRLQTSSQPPEPAQFPPTTAAKEEANQADSQPPSAAKPALHQSPALDETPTANATVRPDAQAAARKLRRPLAATTRQRTSRARTANPRLARALRSPAARFRPTGPAGDDGLVRFESDQTALGRIASKPTGQKSSGRKTSRRQNSLPAPITPASHETPIPGEWTDDEFVVYDGGHPVTECSCACGNPTCGGCVNGQCNDDGMCEVLSLWVPRPRDFTVFAGVHAFKGPLDRDRDSGNFGFHEGFNWGGKFPWWNGSNLGYQVGYQLTHSQLHGSENQGGTPTADPHTQQFATLGLFRRAQCAGCQWGVAWDVLRDERDGAVDFHQIRTEIGLLSDRGREFGFLAAVHTNDTSPTNTPFRSVDQYLFYYRIHARKGGEARLLAGLDDNNKGILGANLFTPIHDCWSLAGGFRYLIPEEDTGGLGAQEEAWNLSMTLVWHFGRSARGCHKNQYRPLFNVADNGSLIVDSRP